MSELRLFYFGFMAVPAVKEFLMDKLKCKSGDFLQVDLQQGVYVIKFKRNDLVGRLKSIMSGKVFHHKHKERNDICKLMLLEDIPWTKIKLFSVPEFVTADHLRLSLEQYGRIDMNVEREPITMGYNSGTVSLNIFDVNPLPCTVEIEYFHDGVMTKKCQLAIVE